MKIQIHAVILSRDTDTQTVFLMFINEEPISTTCVWTYSEI